jgi:hypothetical protein
MLQSMLHTVASASDPCLGDTDGVRSSRMRRLSPAAWWSASRLHGIDSVVSKGRASASRFGPAATYLGLISCKQKGAIT